MKHQKLLNPVLVLSLILASVAALANPFAAQASPAASVKYVDTLAVGWTHTCALTAAGGVKCWGRNPQGNLGDGTTTDSSTPVDVIGLSSGVIDITAGFQTTCALMNTGSVKCWGWNYYGQLGDGTTTDRYAPVDVVGLNDVVDIQAYDSNVCALTGSGAMKCWGRNEQGQLGDGTNTEHHTPVNVSGLTNGVAAMSESAVHTPCVVMQDGGLKCWGWNNHGQVGDGTLTDRNVPVDVPGLSSNVVATAGGLYHTCALLKDGTVQCWGENGVGELGDGTNTDRLTPQEVSGIEDAIALSTRQSHTCVLTRARGVKCWGLNSSGELGDGTTVDRNTPVDVVGLPSGVASIGTGTHTCARMIAGGIKCWGLNWYGQVGDGTTTDRLTPVDVNGILSPPAAITGSISNPADPDLYPGDPVSVDLNILNADDLYAAQAICMVDPDVIRPQEAVFGDFFDPVDRLVGINNSNAASGVWTGAISQRSPALPLSGDGRFATVTYEAQAAGTTSINCEPLLSDQNGFTQLVTFIGVDMTVLPFAQDSGTAQYQGRTDHSGITITAVGPVTITATTDSTGNYVLNLRTGEYIIMANAASYLIKHVDTVNATSGDTVILSGVTLRGGDANGDNTIDIGDATLVAANFSLTVPPADVRADINGDGIVNVQDLAILGSNYGLSGDQP